MLRRKQEKRVLIIGILIIAVLTAMTLANIAYARAFRGGNHFLIGWAGTQAFFTDGTSPYSGSAATRIQNAATWVTDPAEKEALRFVSPLYVISLYAPFALIKDFATARGLWMTLLEISLIAIPFLTFGLLRKRTSLWMISGSILLAVFSFHSVQSLTDGNEIVIFTAILLYLLKSIDREQDEVAGMLLAILTMSLQTTVLTVLFILIWAIRKHRKTLLNWFAGSMVVLIGFSVLLIPNWILQGLQSAIQLFGVYQTGSPGAIMSSAWGNIGLRLSVFLTVVIAGMMLREWVQSLKGNESFFVWTVFITIALSPWIGIPTEHENFVMLVPGILYCLVVFVSRWGSKAKTLVSGTLGILIIVPWILALALPVSLTRSAALFLPFPLIAIILLYWTKWWAVGRVR